MKKLILLFMAVLCLAFTGCNKSVGTQDNTPMSADTSTTASAEPSSSADSLAPTELTNAPVAEQSATLYIGTSSTGFQEYSLTYEGDLTPELLIQGIADLTGWDLTLAAPVATGKGGMSICLSNESALFVGPPDPQNEEFHMYDSAQLAQTILDSIKKTLQTGFTGEGGNPDTLDIYYYMEGEQPLTLPDLGLSWPLDQPYQWPSD